MLKLISIWEDAPIYIQASSVLALVIEKNPRIVEKYGEHVKVTTNIPHMITSYKSDVQIQSLTTTYSVKDCIEDIEWRINETLE